MKKPPLSKIPKQASRRGYAIVHRPSGDFWSPMLFESPVRAREFFDSFWATYPGGHNVPWRNYKVVEARQSLRFVGEVK